MQLGVGFTAICMLIKVLSLNLPKYPFESSTFYTFGYRKRFPVKIWYVQVRIGTSSSDLVGPVKNWYVELRIGTSS